MLIFLTNHLMTKSKLRELKIPMTFVCFGYVEGMLFRHYAHNQSTFVLAEHRYKSGNTVVYGALYHLNDAFHYARILDALMRCSLSSMSLNHPLDLHHRIIADITPITFDTLEEFDLLLYKESDESVKAYTYVANPIHPEIEYRMKKVKYKRTFRISNGVEAKSFIQLYNENREA